MEDFGCTDCVLRPDAESAEVASLARRLLAEDEHAARQVRLQAISRDKAEHVLRMWDDVAACLRGAKEMEADPDPREKAGNSIGLRF
jgi:hypothetical protein